MGENYEYENVKVTREWVIATMVFNRPNNKIGIPHINS